MNNVIITTTTKILVINVRGNSQRDGRSICRVQLRPWQFDLRISPVTSRSLSVNLHPSRTKFRTVASGCFAFTIISRVLERQQIL